MRLTYEQQYAPGLDSFFETTWYTELGGDYLTADLESAHYFIYCLDRFSHPGKCQEEFPALEARLVWNLVCLPRFVPTDPRVHSLLHRIDTTQHLLTGDFLDTAFVPRIPSPIPQDQHPDSPRALLHSELNFWRSLSVFVSIDDTPSSDPEVTEPALYAADMSMRDNLRSLENRDVLYSIAMARHFGGRAKDYHPSQTLVHGPKDPTDQESPISKLIIARSFIPHEAIVGTTLAVQNICGMAMRSWSRGAPQDSPSF